MEVELGAVDVEHYESGAGLGSGVLLGCLPGQLGEHGREVLWPPG